MIAAFQGFQGVGSDVTPPTITNVAPTVDTIPGVGGGFPATRSAASVTPITFDVADVAPGLRAVVITCKLGNRTETLIVHNGTRFLAPFDQGSTRTVIANGYHFSVQMTGGWPFTPSIGFEVYAVDQAGNLAGGLPA